MNWMYFFVSYLWPYTFGELIDIIEVWPAHFVGNNDGDPSSLLELGFVAIDKSS